VLSPLRVLHLCAGNLFGGVERIVAQCATSRHLAGAMEPSFAVCFEGRLARELDTAGVSCTRLGPVRVRAPWSIGRGRRALARILDARRPDVAVCHSSWMFALAAPVARARGVRTALWLHNRVTGRTWVERWARGTTPDLLVCNSEFTAGSARAMYPTLTPAVLYAPVESSTVGPADPQALRQNLEAPDEVPVVLIASRFEPSKGHLGLLAALAGIDRPWRLWIAGGAQKPEDAKLERASRTEAARLGITARVRFLGERQDVAALMRSADLHCQPNRGPESFGLAFVEALYAGLPVVTTDMGGAREIITAECGLLVPPGDPAALRDALAFLLADGAARRRLGAAGPARAAALCDPARQLAGLASLLGAPIHAGRSA
jgi:glycosyltransferase involved in cell wall biosynthesis